MKMANIELHVHPFLENITPINIVEVMKNRNIDVLAVEALDSSIFPHIAEQAKRCYPRVVCDRAGIILPDNKYILNGREYSTKEGFHLLTIGYSMDDAVPETEIRKIIDKGLENNALIIIDHPFIDNEKTKTAGHISEDLEQELEKLCKEYSGQITLEWNGYCIPWMRRMLKMGLNVFGFGIRYHDVNKKAENLSNLLMKQGYNVPIVADTDLHARTKRHLQHMGTSRIITDVSKGTPAEVVDSMRKNIFEGNYTNIKRYVTMFHLLEAFCIPIIFPKYFRRPRA